MMVEVSECMHRASPTYQDHGVGRVQASEKIYTNVWAMMNGQGVSLTFAQDTTQHTTNYGWYRLRGYAGWSY